MKANELRIGNLVMVDNNVVKINDIGNAWHTHLPIVDDGFNWVSPKTRIKKYKSIPLTEEWLVKFGFDVSLSHCISLGGFLLCGTNSMYIYRGTELSPTIKYVHKLQNLYFALTDEELTIKTK